jgi:hypothetical protein
MHLTSATQLQLQPAPEPCLVLLAGADGQPHVSVCSSSSSSSSMGDAAIGGGGDSGAHSRLLNALSSRDTSLEQLLVAGEHAMLHGAVWCSGSTSCNAAYRHKLTSTGNTAGDVGIVDAPDMDGAMLVGEALKVGKQLPDFAAGMPLFQQLGCQLLALRYGWAVRRDLLQPFVLPGTVLDEAAVRAATSSVHLRADMRGRGGQRLHKHGVGVDTPAVSAAAAAAGASALRSANHGRAAGAAGQAAAGRRRQRQQPGRERRQQQHQQ